ncbi:MAG: tetratricopeptide repeat protein, partial [Candidatus Krumholzibacteria bacterium]|nr:tetratricopeptide repeat protein [Candidatus Krumholzibacteria bacterium]
EDLIARKLYGSDARTVLAEVEYRLGNKEAALALLEELRNDPEISPFQILRFIAKVNLELDRPGEARRILLEASRLREADFYVFYELGLLDADAGKTDSALAALEKALEIDPDYVNARVARARLLRGAGRTSEAETEYREILRFESFNRDAVEGLAEILFTERKYAEGAALLAPLHDNGSLDERGELIYGRFLYRAGMNEQALSVFNGLMKKTGESPALLRVVSEMEIERGHFRTAYGYLKRLIELEPDRFENYIGLLLICYRGAEGPSGPDEALELSEAERRAYLAKAAGRAGEDSAEDNFLLGSILRKGGEVEDAERFLLKAERLDPKNESTAMELAMLYGHAGRFDDALGRIIPLYDGNREDPVVANLYGYLLAEKGENLDLAETLLGKALDREPENGYFLDSLGWIRYKKGQFRDALGIFLKALDRVPDDAVIWDHVGDTYLKLNEPAKALEAYEKSLAIDPAGAGVGEKARKLRSDEKVR